MKQTRYTVPNPARPGARKEVSLITDRAKRYRANADIEPGPELCGYCGRPSTMVDHVDGNESHGEQANLLRSCRRCNTEKANTMHACGLGKRTVQYNPDAKPAANVAQWVWATSRIRRRDPRTGHLLPRDSWKVEAPVAEVKAAVAMIRATPHAKRAEFAAALRSKQRPRASSSSDDMSWLTG